MKRVAISPRRLRCFILCLVCLGCLLWIFSNSLQTAPVSSARSVAVTEQLNQLPPLRATGFSLKESVVRKLAHFAEYTLYGLLLAAAAASFSARPVRFLPAALVLGALSAAADEALQKTQAGRSCQLSDVLLDSCGVALGALIFLLVFWLARRLSARRESRS